tara:strand:- start:11686 stop:12834 length:1149 start_codon:yes stop_codon:yes gene_type:complete
MEKIFYSKTESLRFGANIYRGKLQEFKPSSLKNEIVKKNTDILILRLPTSTKNIHSSLLNMGFPVIHADSLVYYFVGLKSLRINNLRNDLQFELIDSKNIYVLKSIIPVIFDAYQNHYFSNPFFSPSKINEGYVEWASSYNDIQDGRISWLVKKNGIVAGFATCSFDKSSNECEGILYGVMPEFSGQGIYSDIIRFTQGYFKEQGISKMWVSTQLQNYAVQKVWLREGFFLKKSFETYHINAMLNYSVLDIRSFDFKCSEKGIIDFASFSGDNNPLHFDDEYAIKIGFKKRIAHGMIFQSHLSKHFGVDFPGSGTIFIENSNLFFAPVYINQNYKCLLNTISFDEKRGILKVLAKLIDEDGNVVLLSYNTLINKNFEANILI